MTPSCNWICQKVDAPKIYCRLQPLQGFVALVPPACRFQGEEGHSEHMAQSRGWGRRSEHTAQTREGGHSERIAQSGEGGRSEHMTQSWGRGGAQ